MKLQENVARRISMLRFVLIGMVVFLHISDPPSVATLDFSNGFDVLRVFTQDQLGRICVPALTLISGYLLFHMNLDLAPFKLYLKKARTLLIPFFVFNICYFLVVAGVEYGTGYVPFQPIGSLSDMQIMNMLFALNAAPMNNPLHFLRELFVLVLLSPVFGLFLRRAPQAGLLLVAALFLFNLDRDLVMRGTMAVMFYIGGMAAICRWDVLRYDRYAPACALALAAVCVLLIAFRVEDRTFIYLSAPLLVWPMASLLQDTRFGNWAEEHSQYSFFIFLSHMPLIEILRRVHAHVDGSMPKAVFVYGVPVLVIGFLVQLYKVLERLMPRTFSMMIGGRAGRSGNNSPAAAGAVAPVAGLALFRRRR